MFGLTFVYSHLLRMMKKDERKMDKEKFAGQVSKINTYKTSKLLTKSRREWRSWKNSHLPGKGQIISPTPGAFQDKIGSDKVIGQRGRDYKHRGVMEVEDF